MAFYIFAGIGLLVALQCPIRYAKGRKQNDKEMEYHSQYWLLIGLMIIILSYIISFVF